MKLGAELRRSLIAAAIALALAAAYGASATRIPDSALIGKGVAADALPMGLAVVLAILAVILVAQSLWRHRQAARGEEPPATAGERASTWRKHSRAAGMLLIGVAFLFSVEIIGYVPAIFLMICATAIYSGHKLSWRIGGLAAALTVVFFGLFDLILHIRMPAGIWPQVWRSITGS